MRERRRRVGELAWRDERRLRDFHRMQPPFDIAFPEGEEFAQHRKLRREVELLPDEALDERRMIRQVIEDFGGGEAITFQLTA